MKGSSYRYHTADGRRCPHADGCPGARWMFSVKIDGRQVTKRGFASKRAADAALSALLNAVATDAYVAPSGDTFAGWAEQWLTSKRGVEPSTLANYRWYLKCYILPHLGRLRLDKIGPEDIDALLSDLQERNLSAATIRQAHATVRTCLSGAVKRHKLRRNVASEVEAVKRVQYKGKVWSAGEMDMFLSGIRGHRLEALFTVYVTTGCRRGEALALRWDDIDLDMGTITITRSHVLVNHRVHVKGTKNDTSRTVHVDGETVDALRRWAGRQTDEFGALGAVPSSGTLVFTSETGGDVRPNYVTEEFGKVSASLGLARIRLHDVRHSHATALLRAGTPLKVVSERLGHKNPRITLEVYQHVLPSDQADAAAAFRSLLRPENTSGVHQSADRNAP